MNTVDQITQMNQRIFELAKQADLVQWDTLPSGARTPDHESVAKARKFAELIINECIRVLNKDIHLAIGYDGEQTYYDVTLLEHFDVDYLELNDERTN
jgi:hypothetical protein